MYVFQGSWLCSGEALLTHLISAVSKSSIVYEAFLRAISESFTAFGWEQASRSLLRGSMSLLTSGLKSEISVFQSSYAMSIETPRNLCRFPPLDVEVTNLGIFEMTLFSENLLETFSASSEQITVCDL